MMPIPTAIKRNLAYKILRNLPDILPCKSELEVAVAAKLEQVPASRLVDQLQQFANNDYQMVEMKRRCRHANLYFYFDAGSKVQFRMTVTTEDN